MHGFTEPSVNLFFMADECYPPSYFGDSELCLRDPSSPKAMFSEYEEYDVDLQLHYRAEVARELKHDAEWMARVRKRASFKLE